MWAGKRCINIYLLLLKTLLWKEVGHFFRTAYPHRNHVTTHFIRASLFFDALWSPDLLALICDV